MHPDHHRRRLIGEEGPVEKTTTWSISRVCIGRPLEAANSPVRGVSTAGRPDKVVRNPMARADGSEDRQISGSVVPA